MALCLLTPDLPLLTPDLPLLQPDGYPCAAVGGGTLAFSSRPRGSGLRDSAAGGIRSGYLRSTTLDANLDR